MEQIASIDPNLVSDFPCHLSHVNGIDNAVMDLMVVHLATKSVGPIAVTDMLQTFHESYWQKKDLQWIHHLMGRFVRPLPGDWFNELQTSDIQKLHVPECQPFQSFFINSRTLISTS